MDNFCVTQTTIRRLLYNMKINNISCDKMGVVILFVFFLCGFNSNFIVIKVIIN